MSGLSTSTAQPSVSLDEIKRAWHALRAGEFTLDASACRLGSPPGARLRREEWQQAPGETTLAVVGCAGSVGASTVALAAALAAPSPVRVAECCSVTASGLAAASNAELGLDPTGWRRGRRDHVLLERPSEVMAGAAGVPAPLIAEQDDQLTILDVGWEVGQLLATKCWLTAATLSADRLVLVTPATVPGMRRLEGALDLLAAHGRATDILIAIRGPRRRKWPRAVERSGGPAVRRVLAEDRAIVIPDDSDLAVLGLDSREVPAPLISAAGQLLDLGPHPTADPTEVEGEPASWTS